MNMQHQKLRRIFSRTWLAGINVVAATAASAAILQSGRYEATHLCEASSKLNDCVAKTRKRPATESFYVVLYVQKGLVCGRMGSVEHVGRMRVDESNFVGYIKDRRAHVVHGNGFTGSDSRGRGILSMQGSSLLWEQTASPEDESQIWPRALTSKLPNFGPDAKWAKTVERGCKAQWGEIRVRSNTVPDTLDTLQFLTP